jgi:predicted phage terminase large subunit-like protein
VKRARVRPLRLMQFIPKLTPGYHEPRHLAPIVDLLERATREPVLACFSAPPRHEKSDTIDHAIARMLLENPGLRVGFAMYAQRPADARGRRMRELFLRAGGRVASDAKAKSNWETGVGDGGLWSTGIGGPVTGRGFNVFVIDDAIKDRATAESAVEREKIWEWHQSTAFTRLEPNGSYLWGHARWTPDDPIARLQRDGWEYVNLPAIDENGDALCPARYSLSELLRIQARVGRYAWESLYMGNPFARGGTLFQDVCFYEQLPTGQMRVRIGVDFAYTKKTRADYSAYVILGELAGTFYVLEVYRQQSIAPEFKRTLDAVAARYPGVRPFAFVGGQERGVVDLMNAQGGIQIDTKPATEDKFLRAQGVAAQWNQGRVLLPRAAPGREKFLAEFVDEVVGFTGSGDLHDDFVDALSSAYAGCKSGRPRVDQDPEVQRMLRASWEPNANPLDAGFGRLGGSGSFGD